jgi:hypothetical protein
MAHVFMIVLILLLVLGVFSGLAGYQALAIFMMTSFLILLVLFWILHLFDKFIKWLHSID